MLTETLKERLTRELEAEKERLQEELSHKLRMPDDERLGYSSHMADDATEAFEQAKDLALRRNLEQEMEMIESALRKISKGDFGLCENCGEQIDPARLEALPQARFCLPCQKRLEKLP